MLESDIACSVNDVYTHSVERVLMYTSSKLMIKSPINRIHQIPFHSIRFGW